MALILDRMLQLAMDIITDIRLKPVIVIASIKGCHVMAP